MQKYHIGFLVDALFPQLLNLALLVVILALSVVISEHGSVHSTLTLAYWLISLTFDGLWCERSL